MRAIVNGILSYGLLNIPVSVCTAAKRQDLAFKTLHRECGNPISVATSCPTCQKDNLTTDETTKGFEFSKKQYVVLDGEELSRLSLERTKVVKVEKFVPWSQVDELQVDSSYYLQPNPMLVAPYQLLSTAMGAKQVVGVGSQALWGKETPAMIWAKEGGAVVLSTLYCWDEVIPDEEIVGMFNGVPDAEQELANELVGLMLRDLDPKQDLVSGSRRRINEYIEAKIQGLDLEFGKPEEMPEATVDLQAQLRASIQAAREAA